MAAMIDLFRPFVAPEAAEMVARTLTPDAQGHTYLGEGPRVQEFESAFARLVGLETPPPLAVNSCTSALDLALHLCGVGLGDEVITTPMTCTATNGVLVNRKAKIVWADVDPLTGLIDPHDVARKVTNRTKAIMAVDWAGRSCEYNAIRAGAFHPKTRDRIPIIQDAAHNLFVDPVNRGSYVAWSFQAIKHLTTGDGGALLVPPEKYERARLLRWYGLDRTSSADFRCSQDIKEAGYKYHMNDIAASIGLANISHVADLVARHRENAAWYSQALHDVPGITPPPDDPASSWWLYCLLADDRASLIEHLAQRGIAASPVHRRNDTHPAFHYPNGPLPGVDHFAEREVAIPCGWWLTEKDRARVVAGVIEWAHARQLVPA
jgi:dTDP-4-amino-4,6-dideoxy-D-glucose/dTDP-4-amino-2,4-dideoxy-beta-L-xylose transaminase